MPKIAYYFGNYGEWYTEIISHITGYGYRRAKEQDSMPRLTGTAQWCFKDFSTPLRPDNPIPYVNQKGGLPSCFVFQVLAVRQVRSL